MTSRVRVLLILAAVLAVLRLVVAPWLAAQADAHDRLFAVTRQLDRAEAISVAGPALQTRRDALAAGVGELAARAPLAQPVNELRLEVQRQLRAAVEAAGLTLEIFDWVLDGEDEAAGLAFGRVRLQLEGPLRKVAEAHVDIEAGLPHVFVRDISLFISGGGGLGSKARATFELDVYYRPGDEA